jgi:hypothetical protein
MHDDGRTLHESGIPAAWVMPQADLGSVPPSLPRSGSSDGPNTIRILDGWMHRGFVLAFGFIAPQYALFIFGGMLVLAQL